MRRRILALVATLFLTGAGLACAGLPRPDPDRAPTRIQVENFHALPVEVHVVAGGEDYLLGRIESGRDELFLLPRAAGQDEPQIQVDPIGSEELFVSRPLVFAPGSLIHVAVEPRLGETLVTVR